MEEGEGAVWISAHRWQYVSNLIKRNNTRQQVDMSFLSLNVAANAAAHCKVYAINKYKKCIAVWTGIKGINQEQSNKRVD